MSHGHSHEGGHAHSHEGGHTHSHDSPAADHGHTHEILDGPGSYMGREMPIIEGRNWSERAFTVGIGGYVILFISSHKSHNTFVWELEHPHGGVDHVLENILLQLSHEAFLLSLSPIDSVM
jgi:hypothetical protein